MLAAPASSNVTERGRLDEVRVVAATLMAEHLDGSWTFRFGNSRLVSAMCDMTKSEISLSRWHALHSDDYSIRNSMLHEIAHALIPYVFREPRSEDHGQRWRDLAESLGTNLNWGFDSYYVARWTGQCKGGHRFVFGIRPRERRSCNSCSDKSGFSVDHLVTISGPHVPNPQWMSFGELDADFKLRRFRS